MSILDVNVMLGPTQTDAEPSFRTADDLLRVMDRFGIAQALVYSSFARYGHPITGNPRLFEQIAGHEDRLLPCWMALPPATSEQPEPDEFVHRIRDRGVRAVRMLPKEHKFPVSRRILGPLLAALEEARIPLILDLQRSHWSEMTDWDRIFELCEAFPRLPLLLLREFGPVSRCLFHLWDSYPNLHLETSYLQVARSLEEICERFGPGRLLFGSGLPQWDPGGALATLHGSALTDCQRAAIGGDNARRLMGLATDCSGIEKRWPVGPGGFRVWDAHGHLGPWYPLSYAVCDAAGTVRRMDEVGVERITISDVRTIENDPDRGHDWITQACAQYPGRIYGYGGFAPQRYAEDRAAFERILDKPGMVGIKIHCQLHDTPAESPKYRPAYEIANERSLPVLSHGIPPLDILRRMLEELPNMIYLAAHHGAGPPEAYPQLIAMMQDYPNLYFDATGSTMTQGAFDRLLDQIPHDQIVAGSDFPIMDFPYQLGRVLYAQFDEALKQKILWENPARIFERE